MPKKAKKIAKAADDESDVEITPTPRVEIIYEDTKYVIEVELEFKRWSDLSYALGENNSRCRFIGSDSV